jgi:hypothetical protein
LPEVESRGHLFQKFPALRMLPDVNTGQGRKQTHTFFPIILIKYQSGRKKNKERDFQNTLALFVEVKFHLITCSL